MVQVERIRLGVCVCVSSHWPTYSKAKLVMGQSSRNDWQHVGTAATTSSLTLHLLFGCDDIDGSVVLRRRGDWLSAESRGKHQRPTPRHCRPASPSTSRRWTEYSVIYSHRPNIVFFPTGAELLHAQTRITAGVNLFMRVSSLSTRLRVSTTPLLYYSTRFACWPEWFGLAWNLFNFNAYLCHVNITRVCVYSYDLCGLKSFWPHTSENLAYTGCANKKNNPLEKMLYFSHSSMDLSQTYRLLCEYSRNLSCEFYCNNPHSSSDTAV